MDRTGGDYELERSRPLSALEPDDDPLRRQPDRVDTFVSLPAALAAGRRQLFALSNDLLASADYAGRLLDTNPAWSNLIGYSAEQLRGRHLADLIYTDDRALIEHELSQIGAQIASKTPARYLIRPGWLRQEKLRNSRNLRELRTMRSSYVRSQLRRIARRDRRSSVCVVRLQARDGRYPTVSLQLFADRINRLLYFIGVTPDARPGLTSSPNGLAGRTGYDQVTGLPDRYLFSSRLESLLHAAYTRGNGLTLCYIDLDHFSKVNDTLGHGAGDAVLVEVADRLRTVSGSADLLARMGGDEFTLVINDTGTIEQATPVAERLLDALDRPFSIAGRELFLSASVGLCLYPRDGADSATLIKHADSALYKAKHNGRRRLCWFAPELSTAALARLELEQELRRAITQDEFVLYYQPQIDLASGKIVGVESLIRWYHPERGVLLPGEFLAVAEESGLMPQIADWGLVEACRQARAWQIEGRPDLRMAMNISARQFERDDVVQRVSSALLTTGLAPQWLDLELTESMLMDDPEGSAIRIEQLRALGVRVSLDDFGTGYSSLAYLQRFPVDCLKIDRSFVRALGEQPDEGSNATALISAIIGLAHSLGLSVVAEGIEYPDQHSLLRRLGCDEAQGFFYARPVHPDDLWARVGQVRG